MPAINNGRNHFDVLTYTGTGSAQTISGLNFQPDFVWIKSRSAVTDYKLTDSVRGVTKGLISNSTAAESTDANGITAFTSNGFTIGSDTVYNNNGATYVAWCWKAGGTAVTNTAGTIASQVSANPTAGFSVVTYTGNGTAVATVGHGLGVAPSMFVIKNRSSSPHEWQLYHTVLGVNQVMQLNNTSASQSIPGLWSPVNSSVIGINGSYISINGNGQTYVAYCFAAIAGYSAFGSYTGNGSADGPFVWTGFLPRFILVKRTDASGNYWRILDTSRSTYNLSNLALYPNVSTADDTGGPQTDILSNGFKIRTSNAGDNASGGTYIYAAFAENPFQNSLAR